MSGSIMRIACPRCGQTLEYSGPTPRFCSFCGRPLTGTMPTVEGTGPTGPAAVNSPTVVASSHPPDPNATIPYDPLRSPAASLPPERIGGYRLIRCLGGGGMGTVYEAVEIDSGRKVAVKLIRPDVANSPETVERFRREGRLASSITHPRCVFVLAADEEKGRPYIVMELMPGQNLHDLLEARGPLPVAEAVTKILDVIEGLQEAHRLGFIHRDVKPSNCFLDSDGRVKVGDFGLAKSLVGPEELTRSGSFIGTVLYASPEQIRNEEVDHQTDIYSVCATLYYLLTGRAPFQDEDPAAALAKAVADPVPSMRKFRKSIPRTLDEVVLRGLARTRRSRWPNLEELRLALLPFIPGTHAVSEIGWRVVAYLIDVLVLLPMELSLQNLLDRFLPSNLLLSSHVSLSLAFSFFCGFLYFALPEWFFGCSPGKFLTRLRVRETASADRPSLWRATLRTFWFFLFKDSITLLVTGGLALVSGFFLIDHPGSNASRVMANVVFSSALPIISSLVGTALLAITMRRANGYRGLHEILSGTGVIRLPGHREPFKALARDTCPSRAQTLPDNVPSRLGSFDVYAVAWASDEEMMLHGEDAALRRPVWLWLRRKGAADLPATRQQTARATRPRWLADGETDTWQWQAFVATPGCPLTEASSRSRDPLNWTQALGILDQLAGELRVGEKENSLPDRMCPEQVWIQPSGQILLLDAPPRPPSMVTRDPLVMLRQIAAVTLEGRPRSANDLVRSIQAPLPGYASELLDRLMGVAQPFTSLDEVTTALAEAEDLPREITPPGRALEAVLTLSILLPGLVWMFALGPLFLLFSYLFCIIGSVTVETKKQSLIECLQSVPEDLADREWLEKQQAEVEHFEKASKDLNRDRAVVLASWSWFILRRLAGPEGEFRAALKADQESQAREGAPGKKIDAINVSWDSDLDPGGEQGPAIYARNILRDHLWIPLFALLFWPIIWAIWSWLTRGGLAPRLAGITLVGADGRPAARWRCAYRSLVVWLPLALLLALALFLEMVRIASCRDGWTMEQVQMAAGLSWHIWWAALLLMPLYLFIVVSWPNRGPHDRIAGVFPVPR
ncbi:MAG: protein kinase domain-containing protein [Gemmataceae bacterium]